MELLKLDYWSIQWDTTAAWIEQTELQGEHAEFVAWKMSLKPPAAVSLKDEVDEFLNTMEKTILAEDY